MLCVLLVLSLAAGAQKITVGEYNIRYDSPTDGQRGNGWDVRKPAMAGMLNFLSWDIFGAQEVLHNQLVDLLDGLDGYDYIGVGRDDGARKGEYAPIFYKKSRIRNISSGHFWLSETPDSVGSKGWDAALCRICTWGEFEDKETKWRFWMFNLHMDHVGKVARIESARLVIARIKEMCGDAPVILTGDFNVDQNSEVYSMFAATFTDACSAARHVMCETGTMSSFNSNYKTGSRIDHIFLSSHFGVQRYGIHTYNYWQPADSAAIKNGASKYVAHIPSDHYPVEAVVELPRLRSPQDWAQYGVYEEANKRVEGVRVVFIGNSIVSNWGLMHPEFFDENDGYVCRGISGQVTAQMLARFRSDVVNLHPKKVVILAGINDIAMTQGYVSIEHIYENIVSMAEIAKSNGIKVVLCSVLPADRFLWSWEVDRLRAIESIATLNGMLREYAKENRLKYADYYSVMADEEKALKEEYRKDPVHPNREGYRVMEEVIQEVLK